MFLTATDFTGFYQLSKGNSYQDAVIDEYITENQEQFLLDLLGCDLYALFIADLDPTSGLPQTQRFIDIFDAFCIDDTIGTGNQRRSKGMKVMLKGFTYFNIARNSDFFNTISGNVKNTFSNSLPVKEIEYGLNERYNVAMGTYNAIQWYICENDSVYPEYNGMNKEVLNNFGF